MLIALTVTALLAAAPAIAKQPDAAQQQASTCAQTCRTGSWIMTRRDNPDSTVVENEKALAARRSPTNEEINAAETGNVESADFQYSKLFSTAFSTGDLDLQALEAENPDNAQPGRTATSPKCVCMRDSRAPAVGAR